VTLIAPDTEIAGGMKFAHQLYVSGTVTGDIEAREGDESTVVISESGRVKGDIRTSNVIISGQVEGNVFAEGRVELAASARVRGDVHYRLMEMQLGATVDGRMLHHEAGAKRAGTPVGASGMSVQALADLTQDPDS
jgi:cytoskeletal protein CcmA (bactofilin family)